MPDDFKIIDEPVKTVVPATTTPVMVPTVHPTTPIVVSSTTTPVILRGEPPVLVEPRSPIVVPVVHPGTTTPPTPPTPTTPPTTPTTPPVRPTTTALATGASVKYRVLISVVLGRYTGEILLSQEIGDSQKIEDMIAMGAIEKVL